MTALPVRAGPRPATSAGMPHRQLDQPAPDEVRAELAHRILDQLPGSVHLAPSRISVPGARALVLDVAVPTGPPEAFLVDREFAHLHPPPDSSLHLTLTPADAREAVAAGWAEPHPAFAPDPERPVVVMVYAPRTLSEVDVVDDLVRRSHRLATTHPTHGRRPTMNRDRMLRLIEEHVAAESKGDVDATVAMLSDDVEHDIVGWPGGANHGRAAARGFYEHLTREISTDEMVLTRSYFGDDFCVTEHQWNGTVPGTFLGVPGQGRRISFRLLHLWEFRDDRISRENAWLDGGSIVAQLTAATADVP